MISRALAMLKNNFVFILWIITPVVTQSNKCELYKTITNGYLTNSPKDFKLGTNFMLICCFMECQGDRLRLTWSRPAAGLGAEFVQEEEEKNHQGNKLNCTVLRKPRFEKKDVGSYRCLAENDNENVSHSIVVKRRTEIPPIRYSTPEVKAYISSVYYLPGQRVALQCSAEKVESIDYFEWRYRKNSSLDWTDIPGNANASTSYDNHSFTMTMTLVFMNVMPVSEGQYKCVAFKDSVNKDYAILNVTCMEPSETTENDATSEPNKKSDNYVTPVTVAGVLCIAIILSLLFIAKRNKTRKYIRETDLNDYEYDVFLSYCSSTEQPIISEYLLPLLENEPFNLRVCYHHRDFELGVHINDNMMEAVLKSRKTLIVLSESYLQNENCFYEMDQAINRERETGQICVGVIKMGSVENVPSYLKYKNFIDFCHKEERQSMEKRLLEFFNKPLVHRALESFFCCIYHPEKDLPLSKV